MSLFKIKECFSKEEVNRKRQLELDIVKDLAIIFMVVCHSLVELNADTTTVFGKAVNEILGGPFSAPIFMFCMGIGISYSRKSDPKTMFIRGIELFLFGYLLNFFRYIFPSLIGFGISHDASYMNNWLNYLLTVDILPFAGLTFIIVGRWIKNLLPVFEIDRELLDLFPVSEKKQK